jgi:hypothetical protein
MWVCIGVTSAPERKKERYDPVVTPGRVPSRTVLRVLQLRTPRETESTDDDSVLTARRAVVATLGIGAAGVGRDRLLTRAGGGDTADAAAVPTETPTPNPTSTPEPLPEPTRRWTVSTGSEVASSPAVAGTAVYVGSDDGNVYAPDAADGTERWRVGTGDSIRSSPVVASDTVYVGGRDGTVSALDTDNTDRRTVTDWPMFGYDPANTGAPGDRHHPVRFSPEPSPRHRPISIDPATPRGPAK